MYNNTMGIRRPLSWMLKLLSRWAIQKHGLRFIVVAGPHGTKLTGELISELLSPDVVLRKQLEKPFWDYSIPLAILGYEDRRYGLGEWIVLILRILYQLSIGRRNFSWIILQMSTHLPEIASYWLDIVTPEYVVLVNRDEEGSVLEEILIKKVKKNVIYYATDNDEMLDRSSAAVRVGSDSSSDLCITKIREDEHGTQVKGYWKNKDDQFHGQTVLQGEFVRQPLMLSLAVALLFQVAPKDLPERMLHMQIQVDRFLFTASHR